MENFQMLSSEDFSKTADKVLSELKKRNLRAKFYKKLNLTPSMVSLWRSGKRTPTAQQIQKFVKIAILVIETHDKDESVQLKKKSELLNQFTTLVSA